MTPSDDETPKSHHRPGGFQNRYNDSVTRNLSEVLRWKWNASRRGLPPPPQAPTPHVVPELEFLHANATAGVDRMVGPAGDIDVMLSPAQHWSALDAVVERPRPSV